MGMKTKLPMKRGVCEGNVNFTLVACNSDFRRRVGAQETATTLVGMVLGMGVTHVCAGEPCLLPAFVVIVSSHELLTSALRHKGSL